MSAPSLAPVRCVVTGLSDNGADVFTADGPVPVSSRPNGTNISFVYAVPSLPANNRDTKDWAAEERAGRNWNGLKDLFDVPGMTCRVMDMAPGAQGPLHRTNTFDLAIVTHGRITLTLDEEGRETKTVDAGDIIVQRGTNHKWINPSENEWARMVFVVTNAATQEREPGEV